MTEKQVKDYITTMLGGTGEAKVNVELDDEDLQAVINKALATVAPFYSGKRFIYCQKDHIDLSLEDPVAIVDVYDTSDSVLISAEDFAFGGQNIVIYNSDFVDRYATYATYKMLYNEYNHLKSQSWKYVNKILYVHGFKTSVLIEMLVRPRVMSDIEDRAEVCPWILDYCLALAKELVGRKRSKYTIQGAPYQLDGERLISEGLQEQADLTSRLQTMGDIFVL